MFGYAGKILRINLTDKSISEMEMKEEDAKLFIGGSGLAALILYRMGIYDFEPLSVKNVLTIFTGPLTATTAPSTSRLEFCAKSPLTGIWGESSSGGRMATYLKYAGWDGIIIEGSSEKPVYIAVNSDGAEIKSADSIWGLGCYKAQEAIEEDLGEKRISTAVIGPAGENLVKYSCVQVDNSRHAGRTGIGAVMGYKRLKGIAVSFDQEDRFKVELANPEKFEEEVKALNDRIKDNFTCNMFREVGTAGYVESAEMFGDLPVKYFTQGSFEDATSISGSAMAEKYLKKNDGCLGCSIRCGRVVEIDGWMIHGPEYETIAAFGSLQLNNDLKSLIEINYLLNDFGLDSISTGVTIAFAMHLTERGTADFNLKWGDADEVRTVIKEIAYREGRGEMLAEGVKRLGEKFNINNEATHVKGLEIPMHDPRAFSSLAVAYATHNRGACHLPHQMYNIEMGLKIREYGIFSEDRFSSENKGVITARTQNYAELFNCLTMCAFIPIKPAQMSKLLSYATGFDLDPETLYITGERIYNLKRMFNVKCGITGKDDRLPEIILKPLSGGTEGNVPDVEAQVKEYYSERGWDEKGIPTKEKLEQLGLGWVTDLGSIQ